MQAMTSTNRANKPVVHVDESGHTGQDLLDLAQPIFSAGSVHLSEEASIRLLSESGLSDRRDWKFRRLRNSGAGRRAILSVIEGLSPETAKFAAAHKPFLVVAKMVDQLLEPLLREIDVDLYDRGGQMVVASTWFYSIPDAFGQARTETLYRVFIKMHRDRTEESIAAFYTVLESMVSESTDPVAQDLLVLLQSRDQARSMLVGRHALPPHEIDPQVTTPIVLFDAWGRELAVPYSVTYDESTIISEWLPHFEPIMYSDMPATTAGYGERSVTLPLLVEDISFADSAETPQLQIADIVAGASAYLLKGAIETPDDERFHRALVATQLLSLTTLVVWPDNDPALDPADARQDGQLDPATQTARFVAEWRNRTVR